MLDREIEGLTALLGSLDQKFIDSVELLSNLKGRVIVSGMGKSGHIARKIAATLASTGTTAFFVHPGEASHGDLGMITEDDALILLSNSGETAELHALIAYAKRFGIPIISIVRKDTSTLVNASQISFVLPAIPEASPINAPTTSTTMMLAWGDAISVALFEKKGFNSEDFSVYHPGGKLGSAFIRIKELMKKNDEMPIVTSDILMSETIIIMTSKSLGCAAVVDDNGTPIGIVTDGDLRRHMGEKLLSIKTADIMHKDPLTVPKEMLAAEALSIMNDKEITSLFAVDDNNKLIGIIHIHDILRAGIS